MNKNKTRRFRFSSTQNRPSNSFAKGGKSRSTKNKKNVFGRYSVYIWIGIVLVSFAYIGLFYYFFVSPYSFRWKAIYGEPEYPDGYNVRGIDISHYQNNIKWEKLRNASLNNDPVRFIIIKATEGTVESMSTILTTAATTTLEQKTANWNKMMTVLAQNKDLQGIATKESKNVFYSYGKGLGYTKEDV